MSDLFLDIHSTPERRIIDLKARGFKTLLVCGRYEYAKAHPPLALQSHPGWLVIAYLEKGLQLYEIDGKNVELRGNQIMRVFPGETYGTGSFPEHRGILYWLILAIDPAVLKEGAWGMSEAAAKELLAILLDRRTPRIESASSLIGPAFERIFELESDDTPLGGATLRHWLVSVLLGVCDRNVEEQIPRLAQEIAKRLSVDPSSMPSAKTMAAVAGFSVSSFYSRFGKETGLTPKEFAMRWKVNEAKKRLRSGKPVTEVAHELGFSSSQYFASVVKRHSGHSPNHWRKTGDPSSTRE